MRKVVNAELDEGGQRSLHLPWVTLGCRWQLRLECGHVVYRQPRYVRNPALAGAARFRRKPQDVLPAPKSVICGVCAAKAVGHGG